MPLTCHCDFDDGDAEFYIWSSGDYSTMPKRNRRTRCRSCQALLNEGDIITEHTRSRYARWDIEEAIYGEGPEVPLATWYLCEMCSDLWFSLLELGYECITPDENMRELVAEYAGLTRPDETARRDA